MRGTLGMINVNVGRILVPADPLFVLVEDVMPLQRTVLDIKCGSFENLSDLFNTITMYFD